MPEPAPTRRRRPGVLALAAGAVLLTGLGGAGVAALLANGGDGDGAAGTEAAPSTVVTTLVTTTPTTTREVTVTTETTTVPTTSTAPTTTGGGGSIAEGVALTDQATRLLGERRWDEALVVGQRALSILDGSGQTYEGYANYDVGKALAELGRCEEALRISRPAGATPRPAPGRHRSEADLRRLNTTGRGSPDYRLPHASSTTGARPLTRSHQLRWSAYQRTVASRPSSNPIAGSHPSSPRSFDESSR